MSASGSISSKGQITLPIEIRHRLGLRPGDRVEFVTDGDRTYLRPQRIESNPFRAFVGALPAFGSVKEINRWVRDIRGDDFEAEEGEPG